MLDRLSSTHLELVTRKEILRECERTLGDMSKKFQSIAPSLPAFDQRKFDRVTWSLHCH